MTIFYVVFNKITGAVVQAGGCRTEGDLAALLALNPNWDIITVPHNVHPDHYVVDVATRQLNKKVAATQPESSNGPTLHAQPN